MRRLTKSHIGLLIVFAFALLTSNCVGPQATTPIATKTLSIEELKMPTPSMKESPLVTKTPSLPDAVESLFTNSITPNPEATMSQLTFTDNLDLENWPLNSNTIFQNPITHMYAVFDFDGMIDGSQWTAL